MNGQLFSLAPFSAAIAQSTFQVEGQIVRSGENLIIHYAVLGPLAELSIPHTADSPTRKNGLWEGTCFELFLAAKGSSRYWEFNISPSGDWNAYWFTAYREGMEEERAFVSLSFHVQRDSEVLRLELDLDLSAVFSPDQELEAGISAVLRGRDGGLSYWALTHPAPEPDFHRRDGFTINL